MGYSEHSGVIIEFDSGVRRGVVRVVLHMNPLVDIDKDFVRSVCSGPPVVGKRVVVHISGGKVTYVGGL